MGTSDCALSLPASRVRALTANCSVWSSALTTEVPCLLVACVTTTMALVAVMMLDECVIFGHPLHVFNVLHGG